MGIIKEKHEEILVRINVLDSVIKTYPNSINLDRFEKYKDFYMTTYKTYQDFKKTRNTLFNETKNAEFRIELINTMLRIHEELDNAGLDLIRFFASIENYNSRKTHVNTKLNTVIISENLSKEVEQYIRPETLKKVRSIMKSLPEHPSEPVEILHVYDLSPSNYYKEIMTSFDKSDFEPKPVNDNPFGNCNN